MGVTSVRFNEKEEKVMQTLMQHFHCDTSTLIKRSIFDLYEEIKDLGVIDEFEAKEAQSKVEFHSIDDLLT